MPVFLGTPLSCRSAVAYAVLPGLPPRGLPMFGRSLPVVRRVVLPVKRSR